RTPATATRVHAAACTPNASTPSKRPPHVRIRPDRPRRTHHPRGRRRRGQRRVPDLRARRGGVRRRHPAGAGDPQLRRGDPVARRPGLHQGRDQPARGDRAGGRHAAEVPPGQGRVQRAHGDDRAQRRRPRGRHGRRQRLGRRPAVGRAGPAGAGDRRHHRPPVPDRHRHARPADADPARYRAPDGPRNHGPGGGRGRLTPAPRRCGRRRPRGAAPPPGADMRRNLPVTPREYVLEDDEPLVSRTDRRGVIVYANAAFVRASGYAEAELLGQPHNIVRHPDMPPEAFADLWRTLQAGRPWVGMVKNRRKDGDHYWVMAHITPYYEGADHVGYMSVRRRPSRDEVEAADRDYAAMRAGSSRLRVRHGARVGPARLRALSPLWRMSLRQRLALAAAGVGGFGLALVLLAAAGSQGAVLYGLVALATAAAGCSAWGLGNDVVGRLEPAVRHPRDFATGHYDREIAIDRNDEVGRVLLGLKSMQVRLGFEIEDRRRHAEQMARVQCALDAAPTSVMVAGPDHAIVYANPAARAMLAAAADDVRASCPGVDPGALERSALHALDPDRARAVLCKRSEDNTGPAVLGDSGERLGTVAEWRGRTDELALERQLEEVVSAAAGGDFSRRLRLHGATGFVAAVGSGLERLMQATEQSLRETAAVLDALAQGDLRRRITREMHGLFGEMKASTNAAVDQLAQLVGEIQAATLTIGQAAAEISSGNADLSTRTGQQAANLQETASSMEQLTAAVQRNAHSAQQADELARGAGEVAEDGGRVVAEVVATMAQISESS